MQENQNISESEIIDQYQFPEGLRKAIEGKLSSAKEFIDKTYATDPTRRLIFITSGGTSVSLEKNTVRSLENFSTGGRGSRSTE